MATKFRNFVKIPKFGLNEAHTKGFNNRQSFRNFKTSIATNDTRKILMPALSPTMQEGQILKWMKKEGDAVSPGDILCEIQTDKAVNSMDTDEEGILAKILKPEDSGSVPVGQLIGLLVEEGDDWQNVTIPDDAEVTGDITDDVTTEQPSSQHGSDELRLGPAVKRILDQFNLDPSKVKGTGPHGMIVKGDVLAYVEANGLKAVSPKPVPSPEVATQTAKPETKPEVRPEQAALAKPPAPPAAPAATPVKEQVIEVTPLSEREGQMYTDIPLSNMRKVIAKRLTESKTTIPHSYGTIDCKMDQLLKLRKDLIGDGVKVSVNDFIIKAAGTALQQVPEMNAIWTGEGAQELSDVDISVAVATDNGLITPIVKDVPGLGLKDITAKVRDLSVRAREGKLKLDEFQGGSFTISNLGMFGITEFSAVINPPQACILAIGTSRVELDADLQTQTLMAVTLSADARIVSESSKAKFLEAFRDVIENPMLMITQPTPLKREALFAK